MTRSEHSPLWLHLREWRDKRGLSLMEVAERLGTSHSTVQRWEKGKVPITADHLLSLARIYSCTIQQLINSPASADLVARFDDMQRIVADMTPEVYDAYLAIGRKLARRDD